MSMIPQMPFVRNFAAFLMFVCVSALASAVTFDELNQALGIPMWVDDNLWDDEASVTAQRLGWPEESRTSTDSSFRKYPSASDRVLETRPYSLALYGDNGLVSQISMMFANKGDAALVDVFPGDAKAARKFKKESRGYQTTIQKDAATIENILSGLLGKPTIHRFGQGRQVRESVKRWDWNGHAILLASPEDEYASVRIIPIDVANAQGRSRISDAELRQRLVSRVESRPNGDVVLKDIPMVNQGPKGYCVPATWERVMRYMAIPTDMYILAMAAQTKVGGGTSLDAIRDGARETVMRGGRRFDQETAKITVRNVKKYIERGIPIMWSMYSMNEVNKEINSRMSLRAAMIDPKEWDQTLNPIRKAAKKISTDLDRAHMCMIIGYNEKTGEVAVSDSWGPAFAERWMTEEEAQAVSQGTFMIINF